MSEMVLDSALCGRVGGTSTSPFAIVWRMRLARWSGWRYIHVGPPQRVYFEEWTRIPKSIKLHLELRPGLHLMGCLVETKQDNNMWGY